MTSSSSASGSYGHGHGSLLKKSRRASLLASSRHRIFQDRLQPPIMWNIQGMRGQMSSNCLWHACKAFFLGVLIFSAGTAMCVMGFYIDGVLGDDLDEDGGGFPRVGVNSTAPTQTPASRLPAHYQTDPSRPQVRFSKLSFIGPVIMGIGGFIIVATCVMTFEARDSAAKVGPSFIKTGSKAAGTLPVSIPNIMNATIRSGSAVVGKTHANVGATATPAGPGAARRVKNRNVEVRTVGIQTGEGEDGEEGRFGDGDGGEPEHGHGSFGGHTLKFDRKIIIDAFRKFSRTLRTSDSVSSVGEEQIQRYPSAPSLLTPKGLQPQAEGDATVAVESQRRSPFLAKSRPRMPPAALRHTMSIDCPSPPSPPPPAVPLSGKGAGFKKSASKKQGHRPGHERRKKFQRHVSVPIEQDSPSPSASAGRDFYRRPSPVSPPSEEEGVVFTTAAAFPSSAMPAAVAPSCSAPRTKMPVSILRNVNASVHHHPSPNGGGGSGSSAITERHHYLARAQSEDAATSTSGGSGSRHVTRFASSPSAIIEDVKETEHDSDQA